MSTPDLLLEDLHGSLADVALTSMDLLNEIAERYPDAISFAAGRPYEGFFDVAEVHRHLRRYHAHLLGERGLAPQVAARRILQYGPARGIVNDLVARHLELDEGIQTVPGAIVVTVGCQEAMVLVLRALRVDTRDVVLAVAPTYVGFTGAARLVEMPVLPVATGNQGVDIDDLVATVRRARRAGARPRACYVMPDFANPSGVSMDRATRAALLDVAAEADILLLEDNPYGLFHGPRPRTPALKALDRSRRVIYLGTFAKTVMPGARVGYVVADQRVRTDDGSPVLLAEQLSRLKSMLTVNTSPVAQAIIAGKLLAYGCSLTTANSRERALYQRNRDHLVRGLETRFAGTVPGVSWNVPDGGYFLVLTVPFEANDVALELSARDFGLLWTPMSHFYGSGGGTHQLRLAYSAVHPDAIDEGLDRLLDFVTARIDSDNR
jgi:(S)-3,5-dihydroxyphenylglycine transaminase